jgi:hypothetical protein
VDSGPDGANDFVVAEARIEASPYQCPDGAGSVLDLSARDELTDGKGRPVQLVVASPTNGVGDAVSFDFESPPPVRAPSLRETPTAAGVDARDRAH